jgi:hypothetical protein
MSYQLFFLLFHSHYNLIFSLYFINSMKQNDQFSCLIDSKDKIINIHNSYDKIFFRIR